MNGKEAPSSEYAPSFDKQEKRSAKIAYIAEDIPSLTTVFYLFLEKQCGNLDDDFQVISRITPRSSHGTRTSEFISVFSTNSAYKQEFFKVLDKVRSEVFQEVLRKANEIGTFDIRTVYKTEGTFKRLRNYVIASVPNKKYKSREVLIRNGFSPTFYDIFCGIQLKHFGNPTEVCKKSFELFSFLLDNQVDAVTARRIEGFEEYCSYQNVNGWADEIRKKLESDSKYVKEALSSQQGVINVSFPKIKRDEKGNVRAGETEVERDSDGNEIHPVFELPLNALRILENENLSIVVIGPPNSGKTSLVASLLYHSRQFIDKVKTLPQFSDLNLKCGYIDLDEWTPDARRLLSPELGLERKQKFWDQDLARNVFQEFLVSKGSDTQIVFADAPGGELKHGSSTYEPGEILKTVIAPADGGIVITNNWDQQYVWRNALKEVGIPPIMLVSSRKGLEIDPSTKRLVNSTITQFYGEKGIISGRVVGLTREVKLNDEFIEKAVPLLLLRVLPGLIIERKNKVKYRLQSLAIEQGFERLLYDAAMHETDIRRRHIVL